MATARLSLIGVGATMFFGGAFYLSQNVAHVKERVDIWLDPFARGVVDDEGYQLAQSLFAQADGGLFGQGFGQALLELPGRRDDPARRAHRPDLRGAHERGRPVRRGRADRRLPAARVPRAAHGAVGRRTASRSCSPPGLTAVLAIQVFVIVGGVTRVIPLTGVTLPFVSYGGSSIVANMVLLALLLIVSDHARSDARRRGGLV